MTNRNIFFSVKRIFSINMYLIASALFCFRAILFLWSWAVLSLIEGDILQVGCLHNIIAIMFGNYPKSSGNFMLKMLRHLPLEEH